MKTTHWFITTLILTLLIFTAAVAAQDPTEEITPAATEEATPAATEEATPVPTEEVTDSALRIDGSDTLADLVQTLAGTVPLTIETQGPNAAFAAFCQGELPLVMSTRFISEEEAAACENNEVPFFENLLGYQGLVVLLTQNLGETPLECVSLSDLDRIYGFAADGQGGNLMQLSDLATDIPLTVYSPPTGTPAYQLLQALLPSNQVRSDLTIYDDPAEVLALLRQADAPAITYMTLADFNALEDTSNISVLNLRPADSPTCTAPNLGNLEVQTYPAYRPLMLYGTSASSEFLTGLSLNTETPTLVSEAGFSAPSEAIFARNLTILSEGLDGKTYSRSDVPVVVNSAATGEVKISGNPLAADLLTALTSSVALNYPTVILQEALLGDDLGWSAFCEGSSPILIARQAGDCEAYSVEIGVEALVVLASKNEALPTCVSAEALVNAFAMPAPDPEAETPLGENRDYTVGALNWNQLAEGYPDVPLYVLLPARSALETDWIFAAAGVADRFARSDQESNVSYGSATATDPAAYRLEAVANFEGGALTVVRWSDYQASARLADVQALELDFGGGCIAPTEETILNGDYPLASRFSLHLSAQNIGTEASASLAWSMISDEAIQALEGLGLVSTNGEGLRQSRDDLFRLIEEAAEIQAQLEAEATPEATIEATVESE